MTQRLCPRDETPLETHWVAEVELDRCPNCRGIWCDQSELARVAGTPQDLPGFEPELEGIRTACPRCQAMLMRYFYSSDKAVVVDVCDRCRGVWLDDGELSQIILRSFRLTP